MAMPATERKHFLDNLRMITVLLLFPYHVFMIYNNWGESWYIHGHDLVATSLFIRINSIWMMPLLFVIAGMSASYAPSMVAVVVSISPKRSVTVRRTV